MSSWLVPEYLLANHLPYVHSRRNAGEHTPPWLPSTKHPGDLIPTLSSFSRFVLCDLLQCSEL